MTGPGRDPVKAAEIALDAYERRSVGLQTITYHGSPMLADMLIRSLLRDLAAYAERVGIGLDTGALRGLAEHRPSSPRTYPINAEVQVKADAAGTGPVAAMRGKRGYVTALHPSGGRDAECTVRFPGVPAGELRVAASDLCLAQAGFPRITTGVGAVTGAADAERALVTVAARVLDARRTRKEISHDDVRDQRQLAEALAAWTGTSAKRVLFGLAREIGQAAFTTGTTTPGDAAQVAAKDFPHTLAPEPKARSEQRADGFVQQKSPRASRRP
ncbi:hypothetical protein ACIBF1_08645 [Spirillospora sp. NPDC050679]